MFQKSKLSTPHGTLGTQGLGYWAGPWLVTFNSTRYIRNLRTGNSGYSFSMSISFQLHTVHQEQLENLIGNRINSLLSTPHGTLGTVLCLLYDKQAHIPFNSTRYIRNKWGNKTLDYIEDFKITFNSTRYIRNTSFFSTSPNWSISLSTPHGTLGTCFCLLENIKQIYAFNSTRYIRNFVPGLERVVCQIPFNSTRYIRNKTITVPSFEK